MEVAAGLFIDGVADSSSSELGTGSSSPSAATAQEAGGATTPAITGAGSRGWKSRS